MQAMGRQMQKVSPLGAPPPLPAMTLYVYTPLSLHPVANGQYLPWLRFQPYPRLFVQGGIKKSPGRESWETLKLVGVVPPPAVTPNFNQWDLFSRQANGSY